MIKKQLTKKQLYGYSFMKWDLLRKKVRKLLFGYCSFCYDAMKKQEEVNANSSMCVFCLIDKNICGEYRDNSTYQRLNRNLKEFSHSVEQICSELAGRYYSER